MKLLRPGIVVILAATLLPSCASTDLNRRLDDRLAEEGSIKTRKDLDSKASALLQQTPGLTASQRDRLAGLKSSVQEKLQANSKESLKLRALLVEDVLSPGDHSAEIAELKSRLRKLARERVNTI